MGEGALGGKRIVGVYAHPDERCVCVVAQGAGYIVRVDDPMQWVAVAADPVADVHALPAKRLLLFVDNNQLVAYGRARVQWRAQFAADGLRITEIGPDRVRGKASNVWDHGLHIDDIDFLVNVDTGQIEQP